MSQAAMVNCAYHSQLLFRQTPVVSSQAGRCQAYQAEQAPLPDLLVQVLQPVLQLKPS